MGMSLDRMLYLQKKGYLTPNSKLLDIGPQNVYGITREQITEFVNVQGASVDAKSLETKMEQLVYFSTPRPGERTTLLSELTDLTHIEYNSFDVCPGLKTEIFDLNYDSVKAQYRNYYDIVLNFGTTEHVFNQWNSFKVMHDALRVGGVFYFQLPATGYLDHGYYCYTPLFFKDLAKANGYEILDLFFTEAGRCNLDALAIDVRAEGDYMTPHSAQPNPSKREIIDYNIHAVLRKTVDRPFRAALEIATAHAGADPVIIDRYNGEFAAAATQRPAEPLWPKIRRRLAKVPLLRRAYRAAKYLAKGDVSAILARIRNQTESSSGPNSVSLSQQVAELRSMIEAEAWQGHWLQGHRWHTVKELSMGVAGAYGYGIEGDVVEFGTMSGVSAEGLARAIARNDADYKEARPAHLLPNKKLFLFDSFEGLPPTDNDIDGESLHVKEGTWTAGTCRGLSKQELADVVGKHLPPERVKIYEGWFKDTVPLLPAGQKFAIIHVDGDLYSSTMDCLVPLFERGMVAEGALMFFDDWSPNRCSPEHGERRAWKELVERFNIVASDDGSYSLLARRFVIHSYDSAVARASAEAA